MRRRLTLVSMSGLRVTDQRLLDRGMRFPGLVRRATALSQLPPLGLLTIAATVPPWCDVELVLDDGGLSPADAAEKILETKPDLVAFSALTPGADRAAAISGHLRAAKIVTVIGGLHATATPETCQESFDVVVVGDGEPTFPWLLDDWRQDCLKSRYQPTSVFDLANSPLPNWELLGSVRPAGCWDRRGINRASGLNSN